MMPISSFVLARATAALLAVGATDSTRWPGRGVLLGRRGDRVRPVPELVACLRAEGLNAAARELEAAKVPDGSAAVVCMPGVDGGEVRVVVAPLRARVELALGASS